MKKSLAALLFIMVMVTLVGCYPKAPKDVAERFMMAILQRKYADASKYGTTNSKKSIDMLAQFSQYVPASDLDSLNKIQVTMGKEVIDGDKATVYFKTSESSLEQHVDLVKQNGDWKVEWNKQDIKPSTQQNNTEDTSAASENDSATTDVADTTRL